MDEQPELSPELGLRREVQYEYSKDFLPVLEHLNCSILISTYSAGKVVCVGSYEGKLDLSFHNFEQAMGMAVSTQLAVGSRNQIWFLHNGDDLAAKIEPAGKHDLCFLTRSAHMTGNIHVHEMAWSRDGQLWVANTLFSCLSTLRDEYSFVPQWRPKFITRLAAEDRCHLNGMAMENGRPKFVTAMAPCNEPAGWRPTKADSGIVIDVDSNEIVSQNLCMPHSPRLKNGKLFVLNSGLGALDCVDLDSGQRETVDTMPGYTRGLSFSGQFAFVGLSRIRETSIFGGIPIAERRDELRCGVVVLDLVTGRSVAYLEFKTGVDEIFDVQVLPGVRTPMIEGPYPEQDERQPVWVVPSEKYPARSRAVTAYSTIRGFD
ncbi:MAG: TIGR03032 family protein [Planctomycetales bacterium]|nr:TIGR03032 family protein [Planctomycetales bacterium]